MSFAQESPESTTSSFSTPLKLRLVAYFRKHYDLDVKDDEAELFLSALAALYDALSKAERRGSAQRARGLSRLDNTQT